jgi:ligand-binding SRPBCC domain-containing protein
LTSRIVAFGPPTRFVDEQSSGPFARFRHEHRFEPPRTGTRMIDDREHLAPFGIIGRFVDWLILGPLLRRFLVVRNGALAREAETEARGPAPPPAPAR